MATLPPNEDICRCGPDRDKADQDARAEGVSAEMLWFCCDCAKPRPGTPIAPGGEMYEPYDPDVPLKLPDGTEI